MNIGIVTATYLPSTNGVATSTALFVQGLRAQGHEVRLFAPTHPGRGEGAEEGIFRLPSTMLAAPRDYPLLLPPTAALTARLPLADLDVIHTMHPFLAGQLGLRWARTLGVPLVFTAHTQYHQYVHYARMSRRVGRWLVRRHVRTFARAADVVLAPGEAMVDVLRRYRYHGEVKLLPNPINLAAFTGQDGAAVRARFGITPRAPLLIYVGRLAAEKNLETLLAAFERVRADLPEVRLLVVGGGPMQGRLRALASGAVHFTGAVRHAEVPQYLAAADAFATASTSEVLPMSMIEALAARLPLIAARSPAAQQLVRDGVNGVLCEASVPSLAQAMLRALQGEQRSPLRAGAWESAQTYDVHARTRELLAVYEGAKAALSSSYAA